MLQHLDLEKILFLDIETVPGFPQWQDVPERLRPLWEKKSLSISRDSDISPEDNWGKAGIYAEFGKIVCISVGFIRGTGDERVFRSKSFYGDDEASLLKSFGELLKQHFSSPGYVLCAHNGKEFDFPYIARRMVVNGVELPDLLDTAGKKPWEVNHLDTMELWKFGDRKSFTSVALLTAILDIPTPKDDIDGSQVGEVYWVEKNLERIELYCRKDVLAVAQILLRFKRESLLTEEQVQHSE
jgi:hypothetical protein